MQHGAADSLAQPHTMVGCLAQHQPAEAKVSRALMMEEGDSSDAHGKHGRNQSREGTTLAR